jgi:hypothetical protein
MLRPIAENPFADRQIAEFQFVEKIICRIADLPIFYLPKNVTIYKQAAGVQCDQK